MKKKFITFALLAGIGLTAIGVQKTFAEDHNCRDARFELRFKYGNSYDETGREMKFNPSYIYFKAKYVSVGGIKIWPKAWDKDASGGRSQTVYGPDVKLLYNRVIEDHKAWWQEGVETRVAADKNAASQMKGVWSPDYCE